MATGDGRRATGDGRRAVLLAARSAVALYRLLDVAPVFAGDDRITRLFTLIPGSDFGVDVLSAIDTIGGRTLPWSEACDRSFDLVLTASPKGDLSLLQGRHVLLPHGAGFNKSIPDEGSADSASGLDPAYLLRVDTATPTALHALAHPDQLARLSSVAPQAARKAKVIGDPTLDRILASLPLRDRYRAALGTGHRKLLALVSTWGQESLLRRRPDLPARLATQLPYDEYQLALIVHPNERSRLGRYELAELLAPALDAGMILTDAHEEWASVLIAADALVTDHGSTALYYAAAQERPIVGVGRGGSELIPDSPMDVLLRQIPELGSADADALTEALEAYRPGTGRAAAQASFAHQGAALSRLRTELYALLGLSPPPFDAPARLLPPPAPATRAPAAFDVDAEITPEGIRIARRPFGTGTPGHHLAAEHGAVSEALTRSAGVLYQRPLPPSASPAPTDLPWSSGGWTRHTLSEYPGCHVAAIVRPSGPCLLDVRGDPQSYALQVEPHREGGRIAHLDPAVAVSAVHAWLIAHRARPAAPTGLTCLIGDRSFAVRLRPATDEETGQPL
ncbi:translation initiation factor 2 [Streptomyces sp. GESEQ-4]|uniref:translation initiation factor 2 n=1 Tax=Streptomyces sp. GESEQ-4 TaxID=2812655 RepID=UPI001FF07F55|nr:translation initiation factor 2 [Streptomyces sp. GESEQ-4]